MNTQIIKYITENLRSIRLRKNIPIRIDAIPSSLILGENFRNAFVVNKKYDNNTENNIEEIYDLTLGLNTKSTLVTRKKITISKNVQAQNFFILMDMFHLWSDEDPLP